MPQNATGVIPDTKIKRVSEEKGKLHEIDDEAEQTYESKP
jgi:hypothetical protein